MNCPAVDKLETGLVVAALAIITKLTLVDIYMTG